MELQQHRRRVALHPNDVDARVALARALTSAALPLDAEVQWRWVLEREPAHSVALHNLAGRLQAEERWIPLEQILRRALEAGSQDDQLQPALARALRLQGRLDDARTVLLEACKRHPRAAAWAELAEWDVEAHSWAPAFSHAQQALALDATLTRMVELQMQAAVHLGRVEVLVHAALALPAVEQRWAGAHELLHMLTGEQAVLVPLRAAWRVGDVQQAKRALLKCPKGWLMDWLRAEILLEQPAPAREAAKSLLLQVGEADAPVVVRLRCARMLAWHGWHQEAQAAAVAMEAAELRADDSVQELLGDVRFVLGHKDAHSAWSTGASKHPQGGCALRVLALSLGNAGAAQCGRIRALAWHGRGGTVSIVEAAAVPGSGQVHLTGNVHGTGVEAATTVLGTLKAHAAALGIQDVLQRDLHIHFTDVEHHKEGASAGVALALACISALQRRPLPEHLAATGEVSLGGGVRAVAGLHEKLTAARLAGVRKVILPAANLFDVRALVPSVLDGLQVCFVDSLAQAVDAAWPRSAP